MSIDTRQCILPIVTSMCLLLNGCINHIRMNASTDVKYTDGIKTRNMYFVRDLKCDNYWGDTSFSTNSYYLSGDFNTKFQTLQPCVFSRNGLPIGVRMKSKIIESDHYGSLPEAILCGYSLGLLYPFLARGATDITVDICIVDDNGFSDMKYCQVDPDGRSVHCITRHCRGMSWAFLPTALLTFPTDGQGRCNLGGYSVHEHLYKPGPDPKLPEDRCYPLDKVLSYAIAYRLKEMEDSGTMDAALSKLAAMKKEEERQRQADAAKAAAQRVREEAAEARRRAQAEAEARSRRAQEEAQKILGELAKKPPYRIIDLAREKGSDFAYAFSLEMVGDTSIQTFFGVQNIFASEVRTAYLMEFPNAEAAALRLVVQPRLSNGKIVGRAEVLTIVPVSLSYDAGTCRGKLSVRFNPGQAEEARAWVRKNIETLAIDKNIALTTGQLPPAATYYSLGEKIDGNVMEIEFRTE